MSLLKTLARGFVPVNREGYPFVAISVALTLLLAWTVPALIWPMLIVTVWVMYFFRDPYRLVPQRSGLVVSPADGKVSHVVEVVPPAELDLGADPRMRVSIFMNVFDCHVNRAPHAGTIRVMAYRKGKFVNAELDKASEHNERNAITLRTEHGDLGVVQIAGFVARRICWWVREGQELKTGERYGMIRFGSRLDVYFPAGVKPLVFVGQTAVAGETVLADLTAPHDGRSVLRE
jgi:phosphatidylserine decarboxylase